MEFILAIAIGIFYAVGLYLLMRRSLVKIILGIGLLGYGSNLLIFTIGRVNRVTPPIIPKGATELIAPFADPLPQALILTAIVIGFGVLAFTLVLLREAAQALDTSAVEGLDITSEE
jgi:multicomponent Na+:H+ antiporter subunit C